MCIDALERSAEMGLSATHPPPISAASSDAAAPAGAAQQLSGGIRWRWTNRGDRCWAELELTSDHQMSWRSFRPCWLW